jgi:cytosine/adenosine deaminase-related metal-dependent hydrolase
MSRPPVWSLTARWLFPVEVPPLERGTLVIEGERIVAVEPHGSRRPDLDLGNVALLPGLVNAHTHLDLSGLRGRVPRSGNFTDWLQSVIRHRRGLTAEQVEADLRAGLAECLATGTLLVGDIAGQGGSWAALAAAPLRAVVYYELLGLPRARARQSWTEARAWLAAHSATPTCRPGLSPHAPYSVRSPLFRAAAALAVRQEIPLSIHLAETPEEIELLSQHAGPFVSFLQNVGVWDPDGLVSSLADVMLLNQHVASVLFAHGNYLDPAGSLPRGGTVVYCPRTHAYFGHPPHPFRAFLAAGTRVALGTDSLASNPDLDLLAEARFLVHQFPDVPGATLLRMATLNGAEALGWQQETGSLTPGKSADVVAARLPDQEAGDPHCLLWEDDTPARTVVWRGKWIYDGNTAVSGGASATGRPTVP